MNANHRYIQLLCRFKIAMRRQLIAVDLDTFINDLSYRQRCIDQAIHTGCPQLRELVSELKLSQQAA
jgi:hypothetical protein